MASRTEKTFIRRLGRKRPNHEKASSVLAMDRETAKNPNVGRFCGAPGAACGSCKRAALQKRPYIDQLPLHHHPAIDRQHLSGDISCLRGRKIRDRGSDVVRLTKVSQRDPLQNRLTHLGGEHFGHVGLD